MNINAHNLKTISNFIAEFSDRGPVLCTEVAPRSGGTLNLFFHTEEELDELLRHLEEGRKLYREAVKKREEEGN